MTTVKKPSLRGSGYSGYPPSMVPGLRKRKITRHWGCFLTGRDSVTGPNLQLREQVYKERWKRLSIECIFSRSHTVEKNNISCEIRRPCSVAVYPGRLVRSFRSPFGQRLHDTVMTCGRGCK